MRRMRGQTDREIPRGVWPFGEVCLAIPEVHWASFALIAAHCIEGNKSKTSLG